ncbi:MAG TPA: lysophospholipid acyltransferase family protein [Euzebya sp.]|nr:lysophospholipid acyltransferase family protein [Euzebya sp.]
MSPRLLTRLIAAIFRVISSPFIRYEFRGGACIRERDGWIFSANHRSVFDFPHAVIALAHYGKYGRIMIASEFWDQRHYRWALTAINAIPVFRQTDPKGSFAEAVDAVRLGDNVCIMPEGGIHWDPDQPLHMGRFKSGVSRLAVDAEAPVLPIALVGGDRLWVKRSRAPKLNPFRRKVVLIRIADEPLWLSGDDHRANADKIREVQSALLREATRDLQAVDPTYLPMIEP